MRNYTHDIEARTKQIKDITTDKDNANILRRIKENDPDLVLVAVNDDECLADCASTALYCPDSNSYELGWLGYYLGLNTNVTELRLHGGRSQFWLGAEIFCRELARNKSIQDLSFHHMDLQDGSLFLMLAPFIENNPSLMRIEVDECEIGAEGCRSLSLMLGGTKSLKWVDISGNEVRNDSLTNVIVALSMHQKLQRLYLSYQTLSRNECVALGTLLRWSTAELCDLSLDGSSIDDEGAHIIAVALSHNEKIRSLSLSYNDISDKGMDSLCAQLECSKLKCLYLNGNPSITIRGSRALSALLRTPNSSLEELGLASCSICDTGMEIIANSLANNCKLKKLALYGNPNTIKGLSEFSQILCDTSSVNNTFLSNHTLEEFACESRHSIRLPRDLQALHLLNKMDDKMQVAIIKILKHNQHFSMQPFFEWELKALPLVVGWFERANAYPMDFQVDLRMMKLSAIYQFVRGMPLLYVKAHTRQDLDAIRARKMELQREQLKLQLQIKKVEEIECRALGRLE